MRRAILITLAAVTLAATGWAARGAATEAARSAPTAHQHAGQTAAGTTDSPNLAAQLAKARLATGRYATDLRAAKADGYQIITRMIPDMGWHFLNPAIQGFDVTKPAILVYERHGRSWQLGALEWVFTERPATPPLPGATYGSFGAACHYKDGTFVFARTQELCAKQPADRLAVQLLASGSGDPARVGVVPQPRRALQRHQPLRPALQPRLEHPSATKAGTRARTAGIPASTWEILALVAEGLRNAEIARRLVISAKTVDHHHVSAILAKLGVQSRQEAAAMARRLGVAQPRSNTGFSAKYTSR